MHVRRILRLHLHCSSVAHMLGNHRHARVHHMLPLLVCYAHRNLVQHARL